MKLRSFESLLKQGQLAEDWVQLEFESAGFHCTQRSDNSLPDLTFEEGFSIEVKEKGELWKYPKETGFNHKHLAAYLTKNTFMMFIDPLSGLIYGQWLDILIQTKPWIMKNTKDGKDIIVFHRDNMRFDYIRAVKERIGDF